MSRTFPTINGVPVYFTPPAGYGPVDFDNPKRKNDIAAYTSAGVGIFLALLFFGQFLYVKLRLLRKTDAETGRHVVGLIDGTCTDVLQDA